MNLHGEFQGLYPFDWLCGFSRVLVHAWTWEGEEEDIEGSLKPINMHTPCCGDVLI